MSGMTHEEILRDAKEMAVHYPDDRLRLTGREILDFVAPFEARISTLEQENARLREALEDICNPTAKLREEAKRDGMILDGQVAMELSRDHGWLKEKARAALSGAPKEGT